MAMDRRMDPEMAAFNRMMEDRAAALPPIRLALPFDTPRALTEALNLPLCEGGPQPAVSGDRWLPVRGRRIQCRVHLPAGPGPHPVLLYVHGGGWVWNSIDTHDRLMREYAVAAGCAVIGPDYALSPEAVFPQALEECEAVLRWIAAEGPAGGAAWGLDPARIVLGGDSAGANIAAGLALSLRDGPAPVPLRGLLLNYGVFDSRLDTPSYREFASGYGLTEERMRFYWEAYAPRPADRLNPLAAPLRAGLEGLPPCLLHIAELDVLAHENHAMAARLRAAGVTVESRVFPGTVHGFLRAVGSVGAAQRAVAEAAAWLRARLG